MGLFEWFKPDENSIIVKTATSKGPGKPAVAITVADI